MALLACLRDPEGAGAAELSELSPRDLDALAEAARFHRMSSHVYLAARELPTAPAELLAGLEARYTDHLMQHMRTLADLREFAALMDGAGIPWLAFKGPVVAERLYAPPELRTYRDLDVAVARSDFTAAVHALEAAGMSVLDRNWRMRRRLRHSQLRMVLRLGTTADVHWHLLNDGALRGDLAVDMDDVFARARSVALGGLTVKTLDEVDSLVHLALHTAISGGFRLIWLRDIERSIAVDAPPWEEVVERATQWRARLPVAIVLERTRSALGTPIPEWVPRRLAAERWRVGRALDRAWPVGATTSRRSPAALWAETARDQNAATWVAFLRRIWRPIPRYLRLQPKGDPFLVAAGGSGERDAYFREVEGRAG